MTEQEKDDLIARAQPFLNRQYPLRELNPVTRRNEMVDYEFCDTAFTMTKEATQGNEGESNYKAFAELRAQNGTSITKSLLEIVNHFEGR